MAKKTPESKKKTAAKKAAPEKALARITRAAQRLAPQNTFLKFALAGRKPRG